MLLTKPEKPLFFRHRVFPVLCEDSPDSLFDGVKLLSEPVGVS